MGLRFRVRVWVQGLGFRVEPRGEGAQTVAALDHSSGNGTG